MPEKVVQRKAVQKMEKRKAVQKMETANFDFILDIFKTLTNELPEQMMYREDEGSVELKTLDSAELGTFDSAELGTIDSSVILPADLQNNGWRLVGCQMVGAA